MIDYRVLGRAALLGCIAATFLGCAETLRELDRVTGPALTSLAVRIGTTRLIDNATLPPDAEEPA